MNIKISPDNDGWAVHVNGWSTGATYKTYDGASRVASAISQEAVGNEVVVIDYAECLGPLNARTALERLTIEATQQNVDDLLALADNAGLDDDPSVTALIDLARDHWEVGLPDDATICDGCGAPMWLGLDVQQRSQMGEVFFCDDCSAGRNQKEMTE